MMKIQNKTVENRTVGFPETKKPNINFKSVSTGQSRYSFKRNVTQPQRQQNLSSEKSVVSVKNLLPQGQINSATDNTSQNIVFQRNLCISDQVKIPLPQGQACSATGKTSLKFVSQRNLSSDKSGSSNVKHSLPQGQINSATGNTSLKFVSQRNLSSDKSGSSNVKHSLPQGQINSATGNTRQNVVYQRNLSSEKSVSSNVKNSKYKLVKTDSSAESTSRASEPVKLQEAANTVKLTSSISNSNVCKKPFKLKNESICSLKSKNINENEKCKNISSGNKSGSSDFKNVEGAPVKNFNSNENILSCDQSKSESEIKKKGDRKKDVISPSKKNVVEMLKKQLTATSDNLQQIKKSLSQTLLTNKQPGDNNHGNIDTKLGSSRQSASTGGNTNVTLTSKPQQSEFKARYKYQKTNADHSKINSHAKLPPFTHSASSKKKSHMCPQTQMVANVIKSKYRIGNYQTHWNKLCKTTVKNPSSSSPDMWSTTVNMKKFYDRMAKKYGWTDLGATAQKVNMRKFYAKMAKKYEWTDLNSGSTSRVNMKKFQIKMAKKYGWTDVDLKKSGFHTAGTASHTRIPNRHTKILHAHQTSSFFTNRKYRHIARLPHASRMRLDRRKVSPKPLIKGLKKGTHLVLLNGVLYSSNRTSMSKVVADRSDTRSRFTVNRQTKRNCTSFSSNHGPIESANRSWNTTRFLASKAINRSIAMATAKCRKDKQTTLRQYCKFYNRFGRCNRGDNCPYIHDPERIAVCTRFLRGTCKVVDCSFSHKVAKEKMPVCTYFLKGVCNRDDCPYLHVNVSKSAIICPDFLNGYCSLGEKCKKKHTRICPEFLAKRTCSTGKKCNLIHLTSGGGGGKKKRKSISKSSDTEHRTEKGKPPSDDTPGVKDRKRGMTEENENEADIPFKYRKLPTFISLDSNQGDKKSNLDVDAQAEKKQTPDTKGIRIKPQL